LVAAYHEWLAERDPLLEFDPDQPRVAAGSSEGGQFASKNGGGAEAKPVDPDRARSPYYVPIEKVQAFIDQFRPTYDSFTADFHSSFAQFGQTEARFKNADSLQEKLVRKGYGLDHVADVVGTRITVASIKDLNAARLAIYDKYGSAIIKEENKVNRADDSGYRALHFDLRVNGMPVEVQLRTARQSKFAEWCHPTVYKGALNGLPRAISYARRVSSALYRADLGGKYEQPECPPAVLRAKGCFAG
jgi:ppGpp synthetase/RelA/SpoT-type nucleotidyltranferase